VSAPSPGSGASAGRNDYSVSAIVPLAVLRTLQKLDYTDTADLEEFASEVAPKRLGTSATVSAQIGRYEELAKNGGTVDRDEVAQLFRLVGRRNDAALAFSEAGRLAAEEIVSKTSTASRLVHRAGKVVARQRANLALAKRLAGRLLGVTISAADADGIVATANGSLTASEPDAKPCGFFSAALGELLRRCTDFEGAMIHHKCRARGDDVCSWRAGKVD
jgi:hypothetical protein